MIINFEEKLRYGQLSSEFIEELENSVKRRIKEEPELMAEITQKVKEEWDEKTDEEIAKFVELEIDDIASEAVGRVKIFCEFDIEVNI